jgi:hypothetical protein
MPCAAGEPSRGRFEDSQRPVSLKPVAGDVDVFDPPRVRLVEGHPGVRQAQYQIPLPARVVQLSREGPVYSRAPGHRPA